MNRQQLHSALAQATTSTFEELALLVVDAAEPIAADGAPRPACGVRVDFDGPWGGSVVVRVSDDVLDGAAANMLGSDAPPAEPLRRDALGELANVICGNVLPGIAGRTAVFALQAPRWIGAADAACAAADLRIATALEVDDGGIVVELHVPAYLVADAAPEAAYA